MKFGKHITFVLTALAAIIILCAAGNNSTKQEIVRQTIQENKADNLPVNPCTAFKEGEVLTYRLHYGFMDAGVAILEVKPDVKEISGRRVLHIVGTGFSRGSFDWFFKVRDRYETYLDKDAGIPWLFVRRVEEGGYKFSQDYVFNHYTKKVDIGGGEKMDIPAGVQDMLSAFYSARNLDFTDAKENQIYSVMSFVDKELWPVKIRFISRETIETDIGKFKCLKFHPLVQRGRVFKSEDDLNIWITDDKNHIPVRAQAKILVGSIKLDITGTANLANESAKVN